MDDRTPPRISGQIESALYVADLDRSVAFYQRVFGFPCILGEERMAALEVPGGSVLLLFRRGGSIHPSPSPGGMIPPHDGHGTLHLAFGIPVASLGEWERRLAALGIPIESRVVQTHKGTSLYFRDPDGHSVEVATPGLWANY